MNSKITVLAVDDNPMNIAVMEALLNDEYQLLTASSGEEALEIARAQQPELILLDVMMPGIDGYETCHRLRADPNCKHIKIILVTAKGMRSERLTGYEVGADDYITKPFDKNELLAKIKVFLRLKSAEDLDRIKTLWMERLDYEIRRPLAGIMPAGEQLLTEDEMSTDERKMWGSIIMDCASRMAATAEKCRLLCQFKAGTTELALEDVNLSELAHRSVSESEALAREKHIRVDVIDKSTQAAKADPRYMQLVAKYLIENAIRHAAENSEVRIVIKSIGQKASISISNTAESQTDEILGAILRPFDAAEPGEELGSQLSIPLAQEIIRAHAGDFQASVKEGLVSIRCSLPASQAVPASMA